LVIFKTLGLLLEDASRQGQPKVASFASGALDLDRRIVALGDPLGEDQPQA
jgi:hypothetical protein